MDVITTHLNADFDALASMVAAKKYYPHAVLVFPGSQEKNVRDFLGVSQTDLDIRRFKDIDIEEVNRLVIVDVKSVSRIGKVAEILHQKGLSVHIYDHHPPSEDDIKGQKEVIENVGATTTIFTEMIQQDSIYISPAEATTLMLGIYEETGSLVFSTTTVRDLNAAAYLLRKGANLNIVSNFITRELNSEDIDLLNELIHRSKDYVIHNVRVKIAKAARESYIGDIAFLAHKIRDMGEVDAVFLLVMMEDKLQVIARSLVPELDVAEVLRDFGGGGHAQASSAVIKNMSLEETERELLGTIERKIHPTKTARDIMTSPVKCIQSNSAVKTAEKMMTKFAVNVLPVLKKEDYHGLISREVVEKALFHGFSNSRVSEFCTTETYTVAPTTSIKVIESLMIEQNQRFMPVVENSSIVGAITRTDLLRSLYESLLRKERISDREKISGKPSIGKNLSSSLRSRFPQEIFELLTLSGKVADELGFAAYLVGGSVRDIVRGESNLDIDIVIEGDGIKFARALGEKIGAKVRSHKRFGTAVIMTDFLKFDVATARTEFYESPAAIPKVEMSSIKKDLYRRDFTINTLAVKLNPDRFGLLLDFFGGQRDIKEKTIRILHNLSFIEDPSRAFRAIRFSERFGFKISKHAMNLIRTAIRINLFEKLSGTRLYDELILLFNETDPVSSLKRLSELDLLKFIHPKIKITKTMEQTIESVQETTAWFNLQFLEEKVNKPDLVLMALFENLSKQEQREALDRLYVPPQERKKILEGLSEYIPVLSKLQKVSNTEIYYTLQSLSLQTILFVMAKAGSKEQKKAVASYLTDLRAVKPETTGDDLKSMGYSPGPMFKKILGSIIEEKLEGRIQTREEEIEFVRKHFPV
jgi:tRNA nucleotidyltransferase (CCA-adding enzyme)